MPNLANGCIIGIQAKGSQSGQTTITTFYRKVTPDASWGNPDYFDFITALDVLVQTIGELAPVYMGVMGEEFFLVSWDYQALYPTRYIIVPKNPTITQGQVAGLCQPPAVSSAITLRTDVAGRTQRATKHLPGVPASYVEEGKLTAGAKTAYTNLINVLKDQWTITVGGNDYLLDEVVYHRANPSISPLVTNGIVQETSRTEKRRVVGRGI